MVEIVVMVAIITFISASVLVNFSGLNEGGSLNRSSRELALNMREAQNMSMSVKELAVGSPTPTNTLPPGVGLEITRNTDSYIIFADLDFPNPRDFKYSGVSEKIEPLKYFLRNVVVSSITDSEDIPYSKINIIFSAPEASMTITDNNGVDLGNMILLVLRSPTTGQTKTITVRTSGQISIK